MKVTHQRLLSQVPDPEIVARHCRELEVSERLATILVNRGLTEVQAAYDFLNPSLYHLPDPFLLAGMEAAVSRLLKAFVGREKIHIYGDYDMDGISATAILVDYLRKTGFQVGYTIPSRLKDGYGLNPEAVRKIAAAGVTLLLTVDCGVSDRHEAELARELGLELIITDHHQLPEILPRALAIINPHQSECRYPDKQLAGVGVAFNLIMGLRQRLRQSGLSPDINLLRYLDLVALGTVADVMPLTGVNRIFTCFGLGEINQAFRPGLRALLSVSRINRGQEIKARDLAFRLAPRVNAVGRIADAEIAVELFL
ncbi:MAG: DHH family phosphoesterase, partial [Deltaproteobacteria bacterium]|nr:DHH family phosphoesterase [Deltaproteobacteria bacterium]